ncbi:hypothetical protein L6452_25614 [Arctium lappa]|uniref:Uncharacterized protein n=1 Tax=Arctium lappa TaxID=4217 RepID=A0ACB9ACL2_ARCLA|nr:hypothetical protein L6452_25614 [Arctium lappa]
MATRALAAPGFETWSPFEIFQGSLGGFLGKELLERKSSLKGDPLSLSTCHCVRSLLNQGRSRLVVHPRGRKSVKS